MLTLIASILLAAGAPYDWQFPGPTGATLQAAIQTAAGPGAPGHLLDETAREAHLAEVRWDGDLGCLADAATCPDDHRAVLAALKLAGQVVASTERTADDGHRVLLTVTTPDTASPVVYTGEGKTLAEAAAAAFAGLRGHVTLELTLDPADANIRLDGKPFGQGSGSYHIPPGAHTLLFEAPGRRPVEQPVEGKAGETLRIEIAMASSAGRLKLTTDPPGARVYLDGATWADPGTERELPAGPHQLRVEADGYESFSQEVEIKPSTAHELSLKLAPHEPGWREALARPHPDTRARPWTLRLDLRLVSARDGEVGLGDGAGGRLEEQSHAMGLVGFGVAAGWRSDHLMVEALGISFESGSEQTNAKLEDGLQGEIGGLNRLVLRPLWVGARYPMWRIEPYALGGVAFAWETYNIDRAARAAEVSDTRFLLGVELGLRYVFDAAWFAGLAGNFDFWPGERAAAAFVLQAGYALDLPEPW